MASIADNGNDSPSEMDAFFTTLDDDVKRIKDKGRLSSSQEAFMKWCIDQISPFTSHNETTKALERGRASNGLLDALWFDRRVKDSRTGIQGVQYVVKCSFPDGLSGVEEFGPGLAKELYNAYSWLISEDDRSRKSREFRREFCERLEYPTRFIVAVPGYASDALGESVKTYTKKIKEYVNERSSFDIFDIERLHSLYLDRLESVDLPIPAVVRFRVLSSSRYVTVGQNTTRYLVGEIPLDEVCKLVDEHQLGLFAKNLRVPKVSSSYNRGMKRVLENEAELAKFWFYNNGLTAVCEAFDSNGSDDDPDDLLTITAEKMQIVNGCQSCYTVYYTAQEQEDVEAYMGRLSESSVLLRLIASGPPEVGPGNFSHKIARYTNSQTPITPRDLRATDFEQGRIKEIFAREWKYFFEVKKDEFRRRCERDRSYKAKFDQPYKFSNEESGQGFVAFWQNEPVFAKASKRMIFENDDRYESIFGFRIPPEALLMPSLLTRLQDDWRMRRGYKLRSSEATRRHSKKEVVKHGNLYILSLLGASFKNGWKADIASEVDQSVLKFSCANLKDAYLVRNSRRRGPEYNLLRCLDVAFDESLRLLYDYTRSRLEADSEENLRNLLIRPSTWNDIVKKHSGDINDICRQIIPVLDSPP